MAISQYLQPTLQDDLVLIRPLQESDYEALYAVASDPLVWEQHPNNDRYKKEVFDVLFAEAMQTNAAFVFVDKTNDEVIGSSRYKWYAESEELEIGWTFFARRCWGGRYNFAVKCLMLDYAFTLVDAVIFHVGITNFRSQKAVLKLRAKQVSTFWANGRENVKFLLKKEDWNFRNYKTVWMKVNLPPTFGKRLNIVKEDIIENIFLENLDVAHNVMKKDGWTTYDFDKKEDRFLCYHLLTTKKELFDDKIYSQNDLNISSYYWFNQFIYLYKKDRNELHEWDGSDQQHFKMLEGIDFSFIEDAEWNEMHHIEEDLYYF